MLHFFNTIPDFSPVSPGRTASAKLPTGPTYRTITINYSEDGTPADEATMIASIESVTLKINGSVRYSVSGKHLVMMNKYYHGGAIKDGELIIDLGRPWCKTLAGEENLCWGTRNVANFFIEVKLAAGATSPELACDAAIVPESRDLGYIIEVHEFPYDSVTGGKREINSLPTGQGMLAALHLESADITALEVKYDKTYGIESDVNLKSYQNTLERVSGRKPQDGYIHYDVLWLNRNDDAIPLAGLQDFRVNPTLSAGGSVPIVMETLNHPIGTPGK